MKYFIPSMLCVLLAACGSNKTGGGGSSNGGTESAPMIKAIEGVTNQVSGMREIAKAKVGEKEVVAVLQWRNYDAARDASVTKWYGDMGRPPAKYVVKSLMVSVDGRGLIIPQSKTRYLASQWMNESKSLNLQMSGKNILVEVMLGDGSEGWVATYVVNPTTMSLVSHEVADAEEYINRPMP